MSQTKQQFRYIKTAIIAALVLLRAYSGAYAQTLVLPSNTDNLWYYTTNGPTGLNTAMMAYGNVPNYFFASAATDGNNDYIYVTDPTIGMTVSCPSTGAMAGTPDIIIGNNNTGFGSPSTNYILATAYPLANGEIEVDYYDVYDDGTSLSIQQLDLLNSLLYSSQVISSADVYSTVHVDVAAEYNNTGITGLPFCNKFVVTWDDISSTISPVIYAAYGDLNNQMINAPILISSGYGILPDVAVITQNISPPSSSRDFTAWITYVDYTSGNNLYLAEYDFSTSTLIGAIATIDDGSHSVSINTPRIDAFDLYNSSSVAHYQVVSSAVNSTTLHEEIRNYDNVYTATTYGYASTTSLNVSSIGYSPWYLYNPAINKYNNFFPTVAAGSDYTVFHQTEFTGGSGAVMFMEPLDITTGQIDASNNHYYWVNSDGAPLYAMSTIVPVNAVSSPPNDPDLATLYAYGYYNPGGPDYEVDYKITSSSYAFRPVAPTAVGNIQANEWQVYPNPALSELTVNNTGVDNPPTKYHVIDIAGRELLQGELTNGRTNIDVNSLSPGTYTIQVYTDGQKYGERLFVKE